jgi:hypothetical protein
MSIEITLVRCQDGSLRPVCEYDQDLVRSWKIGQGVKVKATKVHARSLEHHKLYFGGLLKLAFDYWEPENGVITPAEKGTLNKFASWLESKSDNTGSMRRACAVFLSELSVSRAERIMCPTKTIAGLHKWVKVEAGWFEYEITPAGLRKEPTSINFNSMSQDEFSEFYKAAFGVVWRLILSRTFSTEQEAQNAVDQLLAMG